MRRGPGGLPRGWARRGLSLGVFSCSSNLNINDVLGNYSLTLIDALDTLAVSPRWGWGNPRWGPGPEVSPRWGRGRR